jgi:hypothetical protein
LQSVLGYEPTKIRNYDYRYIFPLRAEKTASFKVNRKMNRWYDHSIGRGGNLINFAILYNNCTVGEFLKSLGANSSFHQPISSSHLKATFSTNAPVKIIAEQPLTSFILQRYLQERRIPIEVAKKYCFEVTLELYERKLFCIGFKNNSDGFELRNSFYKGSIAPKDITPFDISSKEVAVLKASLTSFLSWPFVKVTRSGCLTSVHLADRRNEAIRRTSKCLKEVCYHLVTFFIVQSILDKLIFSALQQSAMLLIFLFSWVSGLAYIDHSLRSLWC